MSGRLFAAAALAAGMVLAPAAASEATSPSYVLVAWKVANPLSIWETPQQVITFVMLEEPTLDALDDAIPCGTYSQVDLYYANQDSAALIAGGVLYGPNNPAEPLAHGAVDGNPWKYVQTAVCAPKPEPRPFSESASTSDCEVTTTTTRTGFFDLTFDPIGNVWTEAVEPTITAEESSQAPVSDADKSAVCAPEEQLPTVGQAELAETGLSPAGSWLLVGGLLAIFGGWVLRRVVGSRRR